MANVRNVILVLLLRPSNQFSVSSVLLHIYIGELWATDQLHGMGH